MSKSKMIGYPSIPALNPNSGKDWLYNDNYKWYIEEKLDGSQLSFMLNDDGELNFYCRNRPAGKNNSVFSKSIDMLQLLKPKMKPNIMYHGESIIKPRHNTVTYDRVPKYYWIMYDVQLPDKTFLNRPLVEHFAKELGVEVVPVLFNNAEEQTTISAIEIAQDFISKIEAGELESYLGGIPEGVVIKHPKFESDNSTFSATKLKVVTNKFKEAHMAKKPKNLNTESDFCSWLGEQFNTQARFHKAYQHCRDRDQLTGKKEKDIYKIVQDLDQDFEDEWQELCKQYLWAEYKDKIQKSARKDFSDWVVDNYK